MNPQSAASRGGVVAARNIYEEGQVLTASALRREGEYFLARDRQHAAIAVAVVRVIPVKHFLVDDGRRPGPAGGCCRA